MDESYGARTDMPAPDPASKTTAKLPGEKTRGPGTRLRPRALVVEDSQAGRLVARVRLESLGFSVDLARDGREAVEAVKAEPFDVILMDCVMPGMDGFETTRRIRLLEGSAHHTPILALTAASTPEDKKKGRRSGMDGYLIKPLDPDTLPEALGRFVKPVPAV